MDAGREFRGLLARVAAESSEADWSPEIARTIDQAGVDLAQSGRFRDLGGAAYWGTSARQARDALLGLLARQTDSERAAELAGALVQLDPTVHDLRTWRAWARRPPSELLAPVRRNSALTNWLAVLPSLASLSGSSA